MEEETELSLSEQREELAKDNNFIDMVFSPEVEVHIQNALRNVEKLFRHSCYCIEKIPLNSKRPATELARDVGSQHGYTGPEVYPTLLFLFKNYPNIEIKRGAHGGLKRIKESEK